MDFIDWFLTVVLVMSFLSMIIYDISLRKKGYTQLERHTKGLELCAFICMLMIILILFPSIIYFEFIR